MIQFEHPQILYLLILVPLFVAFFIFRWLRRKKILKTFGDKNLVDRLLPNFSKTKTFLKFILLLLAFCFFVIALSNPQTGSKIVKGERKGIDIVFCLDISNSMLAEDVQPNRLSRAKQAMSKLLDKMNNDRVGIVIFAGKSYIQLPLTSDYAAAKMFLETVNPGMIQVQGTAIGSAIEKAMNTLGYNDSEETNKWVKNRSRAIVVISDGENHEDDAVGMAKTATKEGIVVCCMGIGLPTGAPIPVYQNGQMTGYKKDASGSTVTTHLNNEMLEKIADAGKGIYVSSGNSPDAGLNSVFNKLNELDKLNYGEQNFSDYEDQYQYFLAIGIILLLLELVVLERKNKFFNKMLLFGEKEIDA